jgi:peptidoglycan/LPS O-acetylase OafA/YrhL
MSKDRSAGVDLIRGISVCAVVLVHFLSLDYVNVFPILPRMLRPPVPAAWMAVDVFFILSGYLLGGQLLDGKVGVGAFYLRRAARILPLYGVLLAFAAPFMSSRHLLAALTFTQNFEQAFSAFQGWDWIGQTWSLAVEEQFYLVLPALVLLVPCRSVPMLLGVVGLVSVGSRLFVTDYQAFFLMPCRADSLLLGIFIAWSVRFGSLRLPTLPRCAPVEWLGRLSYPLYIFHTVAAGIAIVLLGHGWLAFLAAVFLTVGISWALHIVVELPAQRWAKSHRQNDATSARNTAEDRGGPRSRGVALHYLYVVKTEPGDVVI